MVLLRPIVSIPPKIDFFPKNFLIVTHRSILCHEGRIFGSSLVQLFLQIPPCNNGWDRVDL